MIQMKPDVSNMTLEIIEAIKNKETVVFEYGKQELRNINQKDFLETMMVFKELIYNLTNLEGLNSQR